jgi:predicted heme/steroid binding protein/uncharacterized membrane protein
MNAVFSRSWIPFIAALLACVTVAGTAWAKPEYSEATGQVCFSCHVGGEGGELNRIGEAFKAGGHAWPVKKEARGPYVTIEKNARSLIGFLHLIAGFMWFGTILYVHILLKPAYAAKGLPRGEVKIGLASMAVVGLSGVALTISRISGFDVLLESRWGALLLAKIIIYATMVSCGVFVVTVVGPRLRNPKKEARLPEGGGMGIQSLSAFDGKDGDPACIAFEGKVYDVTQSPAWKEGVHFKKHKAGGDLTSALSKAPHGTEKLEGFGVVAQFDPSLAPPLSWAQRVFYAVAYFNLGLVFLAILVIAFWRWGA